MDMPKLMKRFEKIWNALIEENRICKEHERQNPYEIELDLEM